jgi:hypothetical protein
MTAQIQTWHEVFSPTILETTVPKRFIDIVNEVGDDVLNNEKRSTSWDFSDKLVGKVHKEIQIPIRDKSDKKYLSDIMKQGCLDYLNYMMETNRAYNWYKIRGSVWKSNPQKKPLSRSCATRQLGEYCGGSKSITLLGVSDSSTLEEFEYLADSFVRSAQQLSTSLSGLTEQILDGLPDKNVSFYLSVDIDVLALPSIRSNSPYLGTGLTPKQLTSLILELGKLPIIGADVTGYIPDLDISGSAASLTVAEIIRSVIETMSQESVLCR